MRLRVRGGGGGGGASWVRGRGSRTVTSSVALGVASGVVRDLSDPDGLLRPLLRSVAARLAESRRLRIGRVGEQYLRLDPPLRGARGGDTMPTPIVLSRSAAVGQRAGTSDEQGASEDTVEGEVIEEDDEDSSGSAAAKEADAAASACPS
jgi:hypothetical protein